MSATKTDYGTGYLYSEDFLAGGEYKTVVVEVDQVFPPGTLESADRKKIDKWTLSFVGKEKRLVLCKTNVTVIHCINGNPPGDAWKGQKLTLQVRIVESFGDMVTAIRVIPPTGCLVRKNVVKRLGTKAVWKKYE
jgi:hypothetical protein